MVLEWDDLSLEEKTALRRMNRGPYPALEPEMAHRLVDLGLAEVRTTGVGISRAGRELVIDSLLRTRQS